MTDLIIHTDGGSRGNPGPAAAAFVIEDNQNLIASGAKYLGIHTNNFAEYSAVMLAINWLELNKANINTDNTLLTFVLDSELVVRQINGIYKVKDAVLRTFFVDIQDRLKSLGVKFTFQSVPREKNKLADQLVNDELDRVKVSR